MNRRSLLRAAGSTAMLPLAVDASAREITRIGLIADVHKDIIHDADDRLRSFVEAMIKINADAIIQLGDFCVPKPANKAFLAIFDQFPGRRFHVLGNHDTDGGYARENTVEFWGMNARFYSFDVGGCHFVILDANDRPSDHKGGYPKYIAHDQAEWLRDDLARTKLNTFVISHQSLERPDCIVNQAEIRRIIEQARTADGRRKVAACLNGHWHIDHARTIEGIPYLHINSASYVWINDEKLRRPRLDAAASSCFPLVASTIPYTRALFTMLEIDAGAGEFRLKGHESQWLGPGPEAIGYRPAGYPEGSLYPGIRPRGFAMPG